MPWIQGRTHYWIKRLDHDPRVYTNQLYALRGKTSMIQSSNCHWYYKWGPVTAIDNGELSNSNDAEELATMYLTFLDTFAALHRAKHGRNKDFNPIAKSMVSRFFEGVN